MLTRKIYPKCALDFKKILNTNSDFSKFYYFLGEPKPFDVTLRDGLQSLSIEEQKKYTLKEKINLYHRIMFNYNPKNIEIGSIVSEKVLPVFKNSINLFHNVQLYEMNICELSGALRTNKFMLIPNSKQLKNVINYTEMNHFSFITSVSEKFQLKNTKQTLDESYSDIYEMMYSFEENKYRRRLPFVKLYVSCINECPISGKIDNDFIINKLLMINKMNVDNICLSDTCGTLDVDDFEYIVDTCKFFGLPPNKLSLHLHVKKGREDIVEKIIHKALERRIIDFDVSLLETGGCSVTMNKNKITPNLSYELYYKSLINYIETNIEE
jgi:isopropylmalate/homocitrate/citramalate synthase